MSVSVASKAELNVNETIIGRITDVLAKNDPFLARKRTLCKLEKDS